MVLQRVDNPQSVFQYVFLAKKAEILGVILANNESSVMRFIINLLDTDNEGG